MVVCIDFSIKTKSSIFSVQSLTYFKNRVCNNAIALQWFTFEKTDFFLKKLFLSFTSDILTLF